MTRVHFPTFVKRWNKMQGMTTPPLHDDIARWLHAHTRDEDARLLLMAFRNAGKSTLVGLYCAWVLARRPATRIMVLAADQALARKMVRNTKRIIERHPLTDGLKPARRDQWAADQFTVNRDAEWRDPSMLARGITTNITGSRADIIICDDVEVPNTCDTAGKRADLRDRLAETDYVLVPGGAMLYVGTPHTYYSIYAKDARPDVGEDEPFLAGYTRLVLPIRTADGAPAWPERFPEKKIAAMARRSGPAKFESQMMLTPRNVIEARLDPDRLRVYDAELDAREAGGETLLMLAGRRLVSATCWWDPAYGAATRGDDSVIACVFSDADGEYWLHDVRYLRHDPALAATEAEAEQLCRQAACFADTHMLPAITVETNGLGKFLPGLLRRALAHAGIAAAVVETASRTAKDKRILDAFDAPLAAGILHAHARLWDTPFIRDMRDWQPGAASGARDDGLDAVAGCLLAEPVRIAARRPHATRPRPNWRGGGSYRAPTEFDI